MVDHFSTYLYQKRGFYYFSRRVPKELHHCHAKHRIVLALNSRSRAKASTIPTLYLKLCLESHLWLTRQVHHFGLPSGLPEHKSMLTVISTG